MNYLIETINYLQSTIGHIILLSFTNIIQYLFSYIYIFPYYISFLLYPPYYISFDINGNYTEVF
jgi:hypothetical protein